MNRKQSQQEYEYYVDISLWWLKDRDGYPMTVNAIYVDLMRTPDEIGRSTLTKARDGNLVKPDLKSLKTLARLASKWSGENVTVDDLIFQKELSLVS